MRKICVVTGTRAEYGLLSPFLERLKMEKSFELQLVVTGMHLSPEFGMSVNQIEDEGYLISERVEILLSSDTTISVAKSMGLATISFADTFERLQPDLIVILGDRFEMMAVAQTALVMQIPIAHIHGGELSFGAYDDAIRHSITKMATWHFPSTESHRKRIIQLGENPERVWNVGALGIENILNTPLLTKEQLKNSIGLSDRPYFLITYHPETNYNMNGLNTLLTALEPFKQQYDFIFTKSNADNGGRMINEQIAEYVSLSNHAYLYDSLGILRYLSAVQEAEVVIGNSSSGLIEVPYLQTPTVNIGERQAGRECPSSVIHAKLTRESIEKAIFQALEYKGPYEKIFGNGMTSLQILSKLKEIPNFKVVKEFYE